MTDWLSDVALGFSSLALAVSILGVLEERKKRILLEKMARQLVRLARSQERQLKALGGHSSGKSDKEVQLERDKLSWDKIKTIGRALGFDVDE